MSGPVPSSDPFEFEEAVQAWRAKVPMTDADFGKLAAAAREKAFTVSQVVELELITEIWEALDKAIANGTSFEDFKSAIGEKLINAWGGEGYRLATVFRTNVQVALNEGRYAQQTAPAVLKRRPVWKFSAIFDARTTIICSLANGTTLPADDPWWDSHQPPCHHQCRSTVIALSKEEAEDSITEVPPAIPAADGFGGRPTLHWKPDLAGYPAPLRTAFAGSQKARR